VHRREIAVRTRSSVLLAPAASSFPVLTTLLEQFRGKNKRTLEEKEKEKERAQRHKQARSGGSSVSKPPPSAPGSRPPVAAATTAAPSDAAGSSSSGAAPAHLSRSISMSSSSPHAGRPGSFKGLKPGVAILIVPSAITAIVSMLNIKALLEAPATFESGAERKAAGAVKEVSFNHTQTFDDGSKVELLVIDNPLKLTPGEWGQVAGCIAQGSTWQFKSWPFPQGEVEIFAKMAGFYIRFNDEIPNQKTKGWTVTNLVFSREKSRKHEVNVMMTNFWMKLHAFLRMTKPHLLHNARSSRV